MLSFYQCIASLHRCGGTFRAMDAVVKRDCGDFQFIDTIDISVNDWDDLSYSSSTGLYSFRRLIKLVIVNFYGTGFFYRSLVTIDSVSNARCPETHFQCPHSYCLPVYVRCNGVNDCLYHEDEAGCDSYECPGFYRCRNSRICVHSDHLCDKVTSCPDNDDELLCDVTCPHSCVCIGLSFFCSQTFPAAHFPELRYLDVSGTDMIPSNLSENSMLIHASFADCRFEQISFPRLPNLRSLDLRNNSLFSLDADAFAELTNLKTLNLAQNPILLFFLPTQKGGSVSVETLDLSNIRMSEINTNLSAIFPSLRTLNLSGNGIHSVTGKGFRTMKKLQLVDLRGNPMTKFPPDVFRGLKDLNAVYAENYKLCCPDILPDSFNLLKCWAPSDEISSCQALLRSNVYRSSLAIFSVLALLGNLSSFVYRVFFQGVAKKQGFVVFVLHLNVADFVMGVYLAVIGVADRVYAGSYLWHEAVWKNSVPCKMAGFLSFLSSEVSAFIICLIALDRAIVIRFPFTDYRFQRRSAHAACFGAWGVGLLLALAPLMPFTAHWNFYGQTGICVPLPITRADFPGRDYSFGVMIMLNFVIFLIIAAIQAFIYMAIRSQRMVVADPMQPASSSQTSKDLMIASRLATVAASDFLCWFPVGLLGVLASSGVTIPGEVNVAMAIFVLPVNSAINPYLYTLNLILERRQKAREERLQRLLEQARRQGKESAPGRGLSGLHTRGSQ